ncbi:MAG TPA: ABC transporter substrate-binding protein [Deltaproteobacteria bacterium]|nr:ABC transporter substrate-binding protein [Deltaproteobacteria bacterium]
MGRKKGFWVLTLCVAVAASMMFSNALAAERVLKVGVLAPYTGPSAKSGVEFKNSTKMAFEKIDYKVGDYKIDLIWIDSQSDPAKASSAYAEAVEAKGMEVGILNWHSSVAIALMDVAAHYKIPHIFAFGAAPLIDEKYRANPEKYSYHCGKGWPVPAKLTVGYVECLNNAIEKGIWKPKKKLAAIYGEDTDWGRSAAGALKDAFTKSGWEILSEDYFPVTQTDFYPLLSKWKKAGVTVAGGTSAGSAAMPALVKQIDEVGVKAVIIADGLGWLGNWYKMTGSASDYVLDMITSFTTPEAKEFARIAEKRMGFKPAPSASGLVYDWANFAIKIFQKTYEKYGKLDKESIHRFFLDEVATGKVTYNKSDGALIMNEYRFSPESMPDAVVGKDAFAFPVIQYMNGKSSTVYPEDWKETDIKIKP